MSTASDTFECCARGQSMRSIVRGARTALARWWAGYELWHNRERAAATLQAASAAASRNRGGANPV